MQIKSSLGFEIALSDLIQCDEDTAEALFEFKCFLQVKRDKDKESGELLKKSFLQ